AFTSQVVALALFTLRLGRIKEVSMVRGREIIEALQALPSQVKQILDRAEEIEALAEEFKRAQNFLYLGRGYNFPTALEGALKLLAYYIAVKRGSNVDQPRNLAKSVTVE